MLQIKLDEEVHKERKEGIRRKWGQTAGWFHGATEETGGGEQPSIDRASTSSLEPWFHYVLYNAEVLSGETKSDLTGYKLN